MTNHLLQNSEEQSYYTKRRRVLAAVAQEIVTSEDDDNVADGIDICDIIENHTVQHKQTATSSALHSLGETIRNTLLEINEIREQNRERRHKELLQILAKMAQHESPHKPEAQVTSLSQEIPTHQTPNIINKYIVSQDIKQENEYSYSDQVSFVNRNIENSSSQSVELSNPNVSDILNTGEKTTSKFIKILPKPQMANSKSNGQQVTKVKNVTAVTKQIGNNKEELEKMRAQMLEVQRKKMEDRERKKREYLQMQNI